MKRKRKTSAFDASPVAVCHRQDTPQEHTQTLHQKQQIGERIFPLIQEREPKLAGTITAKLLEMENSELLNMLEDSHLLEAKIREALVAHGASTMKKACRLHLPTPPISPHTEAARARKRLSRVMKGKDTKGYRNYISAIPKDQRSKKKRHPFTPDAFEKMSTRRFNGRVREWRRRLHEYDDVEIPKNVVPDGSMSEAQPESMDTAPIVQHGQENPKALPEPERGEEEAQPISRS